MNLDKYILELRTRAAMIEELQGQIGKQVMVRDDLNEPWEGPYELYSVYVSANPFRVLAPMTTSFGYAKLAHVQKKRVLIRDRTRLARILLDQGYLPSANGAFVSNDQELNRFPVHMWNWVGIEVEQLPGTSLWKFSSNDKNFLVRKEWTEEVEVVE